VSTGHCTGCGAAVPLWAAQPRVTADGRVALACPPCARGERPAGAVELADATHDAPRGSLGHAGFAAAGLITTLALALAGAGVVELARAEGAPGPISWEQVELADDDLAEVVRPGVDPDRGVPGVARTPPPPPEPPPPPPIPERDGEPLDEWMPTLRGWVHPVPGSPEIIPHRGTRVFGALREGTSNGCGGGHCGVDLEGERGQPVVAVAWGTVVRIQRDDGGRGGRYVRIAHPDFVYTSYFHLDRIAPDLAIGAEIEPGQALGTLGKSGIQISMPHLHFALEIHGPRGVPVFIDPAPFLARAEVLELEEVAAVPELEAVAAVPELEAVAAVPELDPLAAATPAGARSEAPVDPDPDAGP
jgi:murein DD-endopeptidase MepM/ murein hydrolase activator NlpD